MAQAVLLVAAGVLWSLVGCAGPRAAARPGVVQPPPSRTVLISVGDRKRLAATAPATAPIPAEEPPLPPPIAAAPLAGPPPSAASPPGPTAAAEPIPPVPAASPTALSPVDELKAQAAFATASAALGRAGVYRPPGVYVVSVPRDDLTVLIEGMAVPTSAGVESTFWFYYCPCGKTSVVGQFCVLDFEANDVIDALRAARIDVASVGPMLLHAKPAPLLIRFHAEGQPEPIALAIREGLRSTGKERNPKRLAPGDHAEQ